MRMYLARMYAVSILLIATFMVMFSVSSGLMSCSGDDDDTTPTATATNTPTITPTPTPTMTVTPEWSTWSFTRGGAGFDIGYSGQFTADGGAILCGVTTSAATSTQNVWLIRTTAHGEILWSHTYGGAKNDACHSVIETAEGGFLMAGITTSFSNDGGDGWLIKVSSNGTMEWELVWDDGELDCLNDCIQSTTGHYYACGYSTIANSRYADVVLLKIDGNGNVMNTYRYGGALSDFAFALEETHDGGFILAGVTTSFGEGRSDMYVLRLGDLGNIMWSAVIGGQDKDEAYAVKETPNGDFLVVGYEYPYLYSPTNNCLIARISSSGAVLWSKSYGGSRYETGFDIIRIPSSGNWIIAGYTDSTGFGFGDLYLFCINDAGSLQWQRSIGGSNEDIGYSIDVRNDNLLLLGGTDSWGEGDFDLFAIKSDLNGSFEDSTYIFMNEW